MKERKLICGVAMMLICVVGVLAFVQSANCGEISVQVFMPDKQTPAKDATVILSSPDGNLRERVDLPFQKRTDENGRCRFEGLPEGEYVVRAVVGSEFITTQSTRLIAPNQRVGAWLTLMPIAGEGKGAIVAVVTDNPARAVNNIVLLLRQRGGEKFEQKAIDEFGMLIWSGLEPGEYEAAWVTSQMAKYLMRAPRAQLPNSFALTIEANKVLKLSIEAARYVGGIQATPVGPVAGPIVPERLPFEGRLGFRGVALDENGNPIAKALIQIQGAQFTIQEGLMRSIPLFGTANTDEHGQFEIAIPFAMLMPLMRMEPAPDELKPLKGVLLLRLVTFGAQPAVATERVEITLPSIAELRKGIAKALVGGIAVEQVKPIPIEVGKIKFSPRPTPTARLKLIDAFTGAPIAGHRFTIHALPIGERGAERPVEPMTVKTDENGIVAVPTEGGKHFVRIFGEGYREANENVTLDPGREAIIMLTPVGTITGTVFIQLKEGMQPLPLPNARLLFRIIPENDGGKAVHITLTTDAEGKYKAPNVPSGKVQVEVNTWLYAPTRVGGIFVKPAQVTEGVDIVIKPIPIGDRGER